MNKKGTEWQLFGIPIIYLILAVVIILGFYFAWPFLKAMVEGLIGKLKSPFIILELIW